MSTGISHTDHMNRFYTHVERDVVTVAGLDAFTYLQSQISQDIRQMAVQASAYTFVLQPTGKVDVLARVQRREDDVFALDTDPGFGEQLLARLTRFKIRVKADLSLAVESLVAVRNVDPMPADAIQAWGRSDSWDRSAGMVVGLESVPLGTADDLEWARIEAGWPAMGREIGEATIPAETGIIDLAVSFTKGCYPGQELVERMDSRGSNAPRSLRRVRGSGAAPDVGSALCTVDGGEVAALSSVAHHAGQWIALVAVPRAHQPGDQLRVGDQTMLIEATRAD